MVYAIKRFNCTTAVLALMKYCEEFKDPRAGFPNGLDDIKNRALMVSETEAVLQRESEEAPPSTWLRKSSLSGMNWSLIKLAGLLSPELEQRPFTGNLKEGDSKISLLFPLYPESSFVMARRIKKNQKETTAINLIHISMLKRWAICNRQTLWAPGISGLNGVVRFYSFNTVDVAGHTAFTSQCTNKQTLSLCRHLVEAWRYLGIPWVSQMDNEMAAAGGGRYQFSISQFIRLHLFLGIHLVFIPQGEPGRNAAVESFNALWQERVLQRHNCPTIGALRRTNKRFLQYYHYGKPHRRLTTKENGTRFPGILKDQIWESLRHLSDNFCFEAYIDSKGNLKLPIAKGKVSFIRKVDSHGRIEVNGFPYFIRKKLERQYVVATIFTHSKKLVVTHENEIIKSFTFPIKDQIVNPALKQS